MRRPLAILLASVSVIGVGLLVVALVSAAAPVVTTVVTDADYKSVTVTFSESVTGTGTDGAVVLADVSATTTGATLIAVTHADTVLTLVFDGPVQPATAVLAFAGTNAAGVTTGVPLSSADWTAVEASLRAISLPTANGVPIAAVWFSATTTLGDLLPAAMASSLDLPSQITITRTTTTFDVAFDGSIALATTSIAAAVDVDATVADPSAGYGVSLGGPSAPQFDLSIGVGGTIVLDNTGALTSGSLSLELDASASRTLDGTIGFVAASVETTMLLDASFGFDPTTTDAPTVTLTQADITLGTVTIDGLSTVPITIPGPLVTFEWPTLPTTASDGFPAVATDTGWTSAGLRKLTNIGINDLLFAPSGLATWLGAAQDGGLLTTNLPIVGTTLGESIGVAETLAMAQNQIEAAVSVAGGPFALDPTPPVLTAQNLCIELTPLRVRAERVRAAEADQALSDALADPDALWNLEDREPTDEELENVVAPILVLISSVDVDDAAITAAFELICGQLFGSLTLDLVAGTIEADLSVPAAVFDFLEGTTPGIDLGFEAAGLGALSVGVAEGTWSGTASPNIAFTLGVKLDSDEVLLSHALVVDLDDPPNGRGEEDVTAAHRIYVPAGDSIASSSVSITGTGISGAAQIGFLDLAMTGSVSLTPTVTLTPIDPGNGVADGKVDLAELLFAAVLDDSGDRNIESVLKVALIGDDVDTHFVLSNSLLGTSAKLDIAGDLSGLFTGGTVEFRTTEITGPGAVDPDTLAIGQTFGDSLNVSDITASEVVAMVSELLEGLASNATEGAGDQRIPIIDVSLDEVAGFTAALADVADRVRSRVPTSVSELEMIVNDALAANGMGLVTVGFTTSGPSGDPELTLTVDASLEAAASFPVSFNIADGGGPLRIAPVDGGARLDAAVAVDFQPTLGIRFNSSIPFGERIFVRDVSARFDFFLSGSAEGGVRFGPLEATVSGNVSIGDTDLTSGGFIAELRRTSNGSLTIPLSAFPSDVSVGISGSVPVDATLGLDVPLLGVSGSVGVTGSVPGTVAFEAPELTVDIDVRALLRELVPDLGTLVEGAIETARFVARGADEVAEMGDDIPVVGGDVTAQFGDMSDLLNDIADELEAAVALLESDEGDPAAFLEGELDAFFASIGCTVCDADVYWTGDGPDLTLFTASGIEVLLTLAASTSATIGTTASLGLEPVIEVEFDVTNATVTIGYTASIGLGLDVEDGFYLFPGIDNGDPDDAADTLLEIFASLDLNSSVTLTLAGLTATANAVVTVGGPLAGGTAAGLKVDMPERLPFSEIVNRSRSMSDTLLPSINADIHADLPVEIVIGTETIGVGLKIPFVFDWEFSDTLAPSFNDATFDIEDATLDVGSLAKVVADTVDEFDKYNPLSVPDVRTALGTEVPLIEQTVREAMVALCNLGGLGATCDAFEFLSDTALLKMELNAFAAEGGIPIGSFQIFPAPPEGTSRYTPPIAPSVALSVESASVADELFDKIQELTGGYMTLPILTDHEAIMGILLGGGLTSEVDFIRFEIPADEPLILGPSFNFKRKLFDLNTGFIDGSLSVALNGGIGLHIHGGFGYSSRGIQTGNLFDGIFLIDSAGTEISIGASINASVDGKFSVLFGVASVRFRGSGGFSATAGVDLFDESPVLVGIGGGDGKLYFDEIAVIADAYQAPVGLDQETWSFLCMFQLNTRGEWHLSFSGKAKVLGITVFNESFSDGDTLWDETISCELRTRIARVEGRQLILHAGPNADERFDGEGDVAEDFQIVLEGENVRVLWLPPVASKPSRTFPLSSFDTILADMGDFDDKVDVANAITQPVIGRGGPGDDTLKGGGGPDDLRGGPGNDIIDGRGGNDALRGEADNDTLIGGTGNDELIGGAGNDDYRFDDGFGVDEVTDPSGSDTLDFHLVAVALVGSTAFGDATITAGLSSVAYRSSDIHVLIAGTGDDTFRFKNFEPNGFSFDGNGGSDEATFEAGPRDRQVSVHDTGSIADTDIVTIIGTSGADEFLLRAGSTELGVEGTQGFVAKLTGAGVDRYDYDDSIENLVVDGGLSGDSFTLDDNAANTHIIGGQGDDVVQVGQIFGKADCEPDNDLDDACPGDVDSVRGLAAGVAGVPDYFMTTVITRGHLSNGVTHSLVIDGGSENDTITVFSNQAPVTANGGEGNDQFVARAFIITASVVLNGDGGIDDFTYVVNNLLSIDGGPGVDTFTIVGTEADDGFIIDVDADGHPTVKVCKIGGDGLPDPDGVCAINSVSQSIEVFAALGLEGDDVFWIRATIGSSLVELSGGQHSDRFVIGDGVLTSINGPILISGEEFRAAPAIPNPVVLPGEDTTPAFEPAATGGTNRGDELVVDATVDTTGLTGEIASSTVTGFGMASGPFTIGSGEDEVTIPKILNYINLEFATVRLGSGDDVVLISSTHVGNSTCDSDGCPLAVLTGAGADLVDVQAIAGDTVIDLGPGNDTARVGEPSPEGDLLDQIDAALLVNGGPGVDTLELDNTGASSTRLDIDPGLLTEAGLAAAGVSHTSIEMVNVLLGNASDIVNIRGTAADADETHVYGNDGSQVFYVSSAAFFAPGTGTDHLGGNLDDFHSPLFIHGGGGDNNRLLISDREAASGDLDVTYDGAVLTGLAPAPITHDVDGAFGGGITIWSSELADVITVTGTDVSTAAGTRTLTMLNTGDGDDMVTVAITNGVDPVLVLNTEEGDDTVDGSGSGLGLIVFGGRGADNLSTGSGNDIVLGDLGNVSTEDGGTIVGNGGPGDFTDGGTQPLDMVTLRNVGTTVLASPPGSGGPDTIFGGPGNDEIYGQQGNDELHGDAGDDVIEGNSGSDTISGGDGQDDLIGGGSALDGVLDGDRSWTVAGVGLADENDIIDGDGGADVLLGDNGWIKRVYKFDGTPTTLADLFLPQNPDYDDVVVRQTLVSDIIDPDGSFGADLLRGGDGPDELYGQLDTTRTSLGGNLIEGDELYGGAGEDVLLGDLGVVTTVLEDGSAATEITDVGPFVSATLRALGTLTREVTLFLQQDGDHVDTADGSDPSQFGAEGDDLLLGGDGNDVIHGGSGDDVANGDAGDDVVFGGDGNDAIWGGPGNDELFGGHDEDALDVRPRDFTTRVKGVTLGPDPAIWFEAAPSADALAGFDLAYGGWNTDELQADVMVSSPKSAADRLVDWHGAFNRYLACSGGRGGATFLRVASPSMRTFFADLVVGRGALAASGARELGLVEVADGKYNNGSVGGSNHVECSNPAASSETFTGSCGDLTGDDTVNVFDAITVLQIIVGLAEPSTVQSALADLNRDGDINVFDAITLLQIIVGLTDVHACGPVAS
ncbi:MAG: hypothetical protein IH942_01750 [Acidobacteria bacterium]|nr:hypothetical protein [Acidobacteriota bacterium]